MGRWAGVVRMGLACVVLVGAACGSARGRDQAELTRVRVTRPVTVTLSPTATASRAAATTKPSAPATKAPAVVRDLRTVPFAYVGGVALFHPAVDVERIGFHQASDIHDRRLSTARTAFRATVLASRGRGTPAQSAADVVVGRNDQIFAPVSGIVTRAKSYHLYCKYPDSFVAISPIGHPELDVKILHVTGLAVRPGDRVIAGRTKIADRATRFAFSSEVDVPGTHGTPHVHIEVTQLAVPSAKPQPGKGLLFGCP